MLKKFRKFVVEKVWEIKVQSYKVFRNKNFSFAPSSALSPQKKEHFFPQIHRIKHIETAFHISHYLIFPTQQHFQDGVKHWYLHFSKLVQDWELESSDRLMDLIYSSSVSGRGDDKMCWKPNNSRGFEVGGYYRLLCPPNSVHFPWKIIWRSKILPIVAFFSWSIVLGRILTTDKLWKRGISVIDWCIMCKRNGENVDHLLLHCPLASEMWSLVFCLFGIHWIMPLQAKLHGFDTGTGTKVQHFLKK